MYKPPTKVAGHFISSRCVCTFVLFHNEVLVEDTNVFAIFGLKSHDAQIFKKMIICLFT